MNERGLVIKIKKAVTAAHPSAWVMKVHGSPYQMIGVPDLLVIIDGVTVALEVKMPAARESAEHARARASVHQIRQIEEINAAGGHAAVVLSVEEALGFIAQAVGGAVHIDIPARPDLEGHKVVFDDDEPEIPQRQVEFDTGQDYWLGQKGSGAVHLMDEHSSLCGTLDGEEALAVSGPATCKRCLKIRDAS